MQLDPPGSVKVAGASRRVPVLCAGAGSVPRAPAVALDTSAIRQIGQSPGDEETTSGCMGQT